MICQEASLDGIKRENIMLICLKMLKILEKTYYYILTHQINLDGTKKNNLSLTKNISNYLNTLIRTRINARYGMLKHVFI